jgi:type I restriction enzyme S subunit
VTRGDPDLYLLSSNQMKLTVDQRQADPLFVYYFVSSSASTRKIIQDSEATGVPKTNVTYLRNFPITLPPLPEQRAIAHILSTLDDKIELNRRMNETLEAMARALFKSWFVDFDPVRAKAEGHNPGLPKPLADLFPDSFADSELGEIPKGWEVKLLSELCTLGRGASPRPINDYMNGEVPWVKIADATAAGGPFLFETKERLKTAGVDKSVMVAPGDLILSNSATCGVPMFVELHGCIHDGWLYFKNLRSISKLYLFHVLIELAEHLVHIADGSVQKNLNTELVGRQYVLVPPQAVVAAFDKQATTWFTRMRDNGIESRTLAALRDTLLPKLISGELGIGHTERFIGGSD